MRRKYGRLHHISAGVGVWAPKVKTKVKILPNLKNNEISDYKRQSIAYPLYNCYKFFRACKEFCARLTVKTWGDFGAMWV